MVGSGATYTEKILPKTEDYWMKCLRDKRILWWQSTSWITVFPEELEAACSSYQEKGNIWVVVDHHIFKFTPRPLWPSVRVH